MNDTSLSLLGRLRQSPEAESWKQFEQLYASLIRAWLRRYDVQDSDADDLVQDVFLAVSKDFDQFEHRGQPGAFRAWLKATLVNRLRKFWRSRDRRPRLHGGSDMDRRLAQLEDQASAISQHWNREHDQFVLRQLLALTKPHFAENTWRAFRRVALEGAKPEVVAEEMEISLNAVFLAKSRVTRRLRQESEGLVASSSDFLSTS